MRITDQEQIVIDAHIIAGLRAFAVDWKGSLQEELVVAEDQAGFLRYLSAETSIDNRIFRMMKKFDASFCDASLSFENSDAADPTTRGDWITRLHTDSPDHAALFLTLHKLKHIIDASEYQSKGPRPEQEYELLANHFATKVLLGEQDAMAPTKERRGSHEHFECSPISHDRTQRAAETTHHN
ncbi:hypothetical protein ACIRSS_15955 [Amycolatopsis sp. NPDC101161]|uniref:hypothetical protein n=1 Tax=Amycolatopsis sp. NPDC101161 TaxID=3363940 RepID=UPI00382E46F5